MISIRVLDQDMDTIKDQLYNVGIFASGYESRCTHVARLLDPKTVGMPLVFGFTEESLGQTRRENDAYFCETWNCCPTQLSGDDEKPIYDALNSSCEQIDGPLHILLDYSSMTRLWYAAVMNWARFAAGGKEVIIDCAYSVGVYANHLSQMIIRDIVALPGCEGRAYRLRESIAVFGLGFNGLATLCVLDKLEADLVYAFLACPGTSPEDENRTRHANTDLIEGHKTQPLIELPLFSVETSYRYLAEAIAHHRQDGEISLIPMGPKPHVLASMLVAMRFNEIACLRVTSEPDTTDITAKGDVVVTRIVVKTDS